MSCNDALVEVSKWTSCSKTAKKNGSTAGGKNGDAAGVRERDMI